MVFELCLDGGALVGLMAGSPMRIQALQRQDHDCCILHRVSYDCGTQDIVGW